MREFLPIIGAEFRQARMDAGLRQADLADVMGWGKDAISKLERGVLDIKLGDYLTLISTLAYYIPADHPARALLEHCRFQSRLHKR